MTIIQEKYQATLVGCGIGDALGMPVEGWKREQIQKYTGRITEFISPVIAKDGKGELIKEDEYGKIKYYNRDLEKGEYTDDTILTMAIAESIAEKRCLDIDDITKRQVEAFQLRIQKNGHVRGGFGKTTRGAFEKIIKGTNPYESGISPGLGNGVAMKISPLALYMHATGNYGEGIKMARVIGVNSFRRESNSIRNCSGSCNLFSFKQSGKR